jgi:hypothetical protein
LLVSSFGRAMLMLQYQLYDLAHVSPAASISLQQIPNFGIDD